MPIRKAVVPVAGLGTRILPASKVIPKELLPLVDKPALQYIVEEAVAVGINVIIFVTSRSKGAIEDHFDTVFPELAGVLQLTHRQRELDELLRASRMATYLMVRQPEPLGLGHAILCARRLIGEEPFVVMLADNICLPEASCLPRLIEVYEQYRGPVLSLVPLPPAMIPGYGIASVEELAEDVVRVTRLLEKPTIEEAPSNLGVFGRYVLTPDIFPVLERAPAGRGGEIQIAAAVETRVQGGRCFGVRFSGEWYDTGTPLGLLTSSIALALKRPDIASALRESMRHMLRAQYGKIERE